MDHLTITIPGVLPGKQRARGRNFYTPEKTVNAEAWVRHCAVQQVGVPRLEGASGDVPGGVYAGAAVMAPETPRNGAGGHVETDRQAGLGQPRQTRMRRAEWRGVDR